MEDNVKKAGELKAKGNEALQAGQFEKAVDFYTEGIALDSTNHILFSNRSAAYAKLGKYEEALADGRKTTEIKPEWAKGYSRVGAALSFLKRHEEAVTAFREGLRLDPVNQQLKDGLSEAEKCLANASNPFAQPETLARLAADPRTRAYLAQPDYMQMLEVLKQSPNAMSGFLQDPRFQDTLSVILGVNLSTPQDLAPGREESSASKESPESKKPEKAAEAPAPEPMEVDDHKKKAEDQKALGNTAYKSKDFETALQHYDKAFELDPTNMMYLTNKAAVFFEQGEFDKCIEACFKAEEVGRENRADFKQIAKAYSRIGNVHFKQEAYEEAIKWYQKSLAEHRAADVLKKCQQAEKILAERKRKDYLNPELALQAKNEGNEAFQKGDYPAAVRLYSEAIKRNPEDAKIYSNRAACYTKLAEFRLGLKDCEECIRLDAKFVKGHVRKGLIHLALKESSKAVQSFQDALDLDPENRDAKDGMARCYQTHTSPMSDQERELKAQRAMADPEVQRIMQDPAMQSILQQMQQDPQALREHLKNPAIAEKIQKLMDSGLIAIR